MYVCMWGPVRTVSGHMGLMQTSQHVCMPRSAFLEEATELLTSNPFVPSQPTKTIHINFRAQETIHTYIHSCLYLISGPEGIVWDGMGRTPESSLAAPSLLRDGSILGSYPGKWRCGEDDRSMMASHRNAIWACAAVHAIHTYTCESSCMSQTISVTLPSTVWYTGGGK
jgi:hypothetical protein